MVTWSFRLDEASEPSEVLVGTYLTAVCRELFLAKPFILMTISYHASPYHRDISTMHDWFEHSGDQSIHVLATLCHFGKVSEFER